MVEPTHLKNMLVELDSISPNFGVKITNIWNHHLGVSKNGGTPKWMVYNGKPLLKFMIWGENNPYFWFNTHRVLVVLSLSFYDAAMKIHEILCCHAADLCTLLTLRWNVHGRWVIGTTRRTIANSRFLVASPEKIVCSLLKIQRNWHDAICPPELSIHDLRKFIPPSWIRKIIFFTHSPMETPCYRITILSVHHVFTTYDPSIFLKYSGWWNTWKPQNICKFQGHFRIFISWGRDPWTACGPILGDKRTVLSATHLPSPPVMQLEERSQKATRCITYKTPQMSRIPWMDFCK